MADTCFGNKNERPTDDSIQAAIGPAGAAWGMLFERLRVEYPDVTQTWSYYLDGKSWLLKATRKGKTVFWLSIQHGGFRVAFHFAERLKPALLDSALSDELKTRLQNGKSAGRLVSISVHFGPTSGVVDVMTLVGLKMKLK